MVGRHLHLHTAEDARCPRTEEGSVAAGLQLPRTVVERHLTAEVAADPCRCHRTVVAVTPLVDSVAAVTRVGSAAEVVATHPQEAAGIAVVAAVTGTTKLVRFRAIRECRSRGGIFLLVAFVPCWR